MAEPSLPDDKKLWDVLLGLFGCPSVLVARERGVYASLAERPRTLAELSAIAGVARRPLEAILAVNVAAGMLERRAEAYALTAAARAYLLDDSPTSFGGFLDMIAGMYGMYSLDGLRRAAASDASQMYGGGDAFETHERREDLARAFTRAMHGMSAAPADAWPRRVDLGGCRTLLDVGGGSGVHAVAAASHFPELRAVVFDLAPVCEVARETIARRGLDARVTARPGDMWSDPLPPSDAHFYSMIFHDWPRERCALLARKSFDALPSGGRILVHEMLFDDDKAGPFAVAAFSVSMLFGTSGEQYSGREIASILADAGFADVVVTPTFGYWSVVSGRKP